MGEQPVLPPGYRFVPTDQELIKYYLRRKVCGQPLPPAAAAAIVDRDLYVNGQEGVPWVYGDPHADLYFFTKIKTKFGNSKRIDRSAGKGTWRMQNSPPVYDDSPANNPRPLGFKKTFNYIEQDSRTGKMAKKPHPDKSWIMHEYTLPEPQYRAHNHIHKWSLCRIRKGREKEDASSASSSSSKSSPPKKPKLEQHKSLQNINTIIRTTSSKSSPPKKPKLEQQQHKSLQNINTIIRTTSSSSKPPTSVTSHSHVVGGFPPQQQQQQQQYLPSSSSSSSLGIVMPPYDHQEPPSDQQQPYYSSQYSSQKPYHYYNAADDNVFGETGTGVAGQNSSSQAPQPYYTDNNVFGEGVNEVPGQHYSIIQPPSYYNYQSGGTDLVTGQYSSSMCQDSNQYAACDDGVVGVIGGSAQQVEVGRNTLTFNVNDLLNYLDTVCPDQNDKPAPTASF